MSVGERGMRWAKPLLDLRLVEVLDARPRDVPDHLRHDLAWPCPACSLRRAVSGSWQLTVRNAHHPPHERQVVVCGDCADQIGVRWEDG